MENDNEEVKAEATVAEKPKTKPKARKPRTAAPKTEPKVRTRTAGNCTIINR